MGGMKAWDGIRARFRRKQMNCAPLIDPAAHFLLTTYASPYSAISTCSMPSWLITKLRSMLSYPVSTFSCH